MLQKFDLFVVLITFVVLVEANLPREADNASEVRSLKSELRVESSVVNDNICNNHEKNVAFDVILFDNNSPLQLDGSRRVNKRQAPRDNRKDYTDRARPDQRTLLIVFDATGSMHDDLEQLRAGAQEIVTELSARDDNPIYNYVLVVYRDPTVEPPFDTKNPDDLLTKLKHIQTVGGGDCAEYALSGLKIALEFALPNSLAYVFSDATAKDLRYYGEVLGLIQKKQATVNFLLTGNCDDPTGPGYQVYLKLSRASNGQVYDMNKSNVKDVLLAIRHSVNYKYAALKSVDAESAGTTNTKLTVDKSISELSVSLSGKNPRLTIKDPRNETVRSGDELSLENLKLVKIKDPIDGQWNVESEAESSHSIRLGAISEMKFEFGFSIDDVTKKSETSFQPFEGKKNILTIFASDPTLIKNLMDVTIILVKTNEHESSLQFKIPLKKVNDHIYATKAFDIPRQMFKIQLNGIDAGGNSIERLISTGLLSSKGSAPEITIEVSQKEIHEYEKLILKCVVNSHTSVNITWVFEGRTVKKIQSNQSNDLELTIKRVTHSDEGKYICDAINSYAGERRDVSIKVISAPKVLIHPNKLNVNEGAEISLECLVERKTDERLEITWINEHGRVLQKSDSSELTFFVTREDHNRTITCQIQNGDVLISNSSLLLVEFSPKFVDESVATSIKIKHGENFELSCETNENPRGKVEWFFTPKHSSETILMSNQESALTLMTMNEEKQGKYECLVQNIRGRVKRSFEVVDSPKSIPKIKIDKDVIIVNETDSVELLCETLNSLPITNFSWFSENSNNYQRHVLQDEINDVFRYSLLIEKVDESDNGSFECYLSNDLGENKATFELLVQTPPKIESITSTSKGDSIEINSESRVLEGDEVKLNCVVDGFPVPDVKWYKGQEELDFGLNDKSLLFKKVQESDEGFYQCVATNILGSVSQSFHFIIVVAPKVDKPEENFISVVEGGEVDLKCAIKGKPAPIVSWQMNGRPVGEKFMIDKTNFSMTFKASMADSGLYSCSGINEHGSVMVNYTLLVKGYPKILAPNDETRSVRVNSSTTLSCDATGFPQPIVSWTFNNQPIHQGPSLHLSNLQLENWGGYVCTAVNDVGSEQKVFFVTISLPPEITSMFNNVTVLTNQTHDVHCETNEARDLDIYWTYDEVKVKDGSTLTLTSTMKSGFYTCVAENAEGKVESSLHFEAINKPSLVKEIEELKKEIKVKEGDGLELICPFENFESISWKFNNNSVIDNFSHNINGNKLTMNKIDHFVDGEWRCEVSNIAGNDSFGMNITVLSSPIIHASWNLNSRVSDFLVTESDIDEKTFKVGETLKLNCLAKGFPKPKVTWKKASDVIAESETLLIENLQYHHNDIYTCSAENDQGIVKKFFKIDVVSAPYIDHDDIQKNFQKAIGDSVTLRCRIIGNPIPNIFWFRNNILLDDETEDFLEIKKVTLTDDGNYKCIGKNSWGKESLDYHVSVMDAAKVVKAEEEPTTRNENSVRLSCTVQGNPLPVISWISNGHILSTTSKLNLEKLFSNVDGSVVHFNGYGNSISYLDPLQLKKANDKFYSQLTKLTENSIKLEIVFKDRSPGVAGSYQCYAYNALGRDEKKIDIRVLEKPFVNERQMKQLHENEILEGLPLLLTCLMSGEPSPQITWFKENIQLHSNDSVQLLNSGRFLSIAETFSWNSGNYSCKGVNEVGEKSLEFHVTILEPPKFIDYPVASQIIGQNRFHNDKRSLIERKDGKDEMKVMKGEDVMLECFAKGSPHPNIHWIKMNLYDSSQDKILDENENIFIIKSIEESANFMCYINNTVGNIHKMFHIIVQSSPTFIDSKLEHKINVKLHHGVNLDCQVDGNPEPKVKWSFNGTELQSDDKSFYFSNAHQIMRIIEAKKSDQGKILCEAENEFGKIEKVFYINVEVPIQWSPFGPWSACSVSCGSGGIQYRTRICLLSNGFPATANDYKCVGENSEARKCNRLSCPVNGEWGRFSKWSKCPECVKEKDQATPIYSSRNRKCDSPAPANGGLECQGVDKEEVQCEVKICPIHGGWSDWSAWSECNKPCGLSHRMRKRSCKNPEPKYNGTLCDGENVEYEDCKKPLCVQRKMKKSFSAEDEEDFEEMSNEIRDRYGEVAAFEIKNQAGAPRNFQFTQHREIEYTPPVGRFNGPIGSKVPKIIVSLDTYKPISEETYRQHVSRSKTSINEDIEDFENSSSFENIEFESTESLQPPKTCLKGFFYNSLESQCRDINECLNHRLNNCSSDETCFNIIGSFRCEKNQRKTRN